MFYYYIIILAFIVFMQVLSCQKLQHFGWSIKGKNEIHSALLI